MSKPENQENVSLHDARIEQATVMNNQSVVLTFTNGSSALVDSEELKKLALHSATEIVNEDDPEASESDDESSSVSARS